MGDVWEIEHLVLIILAYLEPVELAQAESINSLFNRVIKKTSWNALYQNSYHKFSHVKQLEENRNAIGRSLQQCDCPPRTPIPDRKRKFHLLNKNVVPMGVPPPRNAKRLFMPNNYMKFKQGLESLDPKQGVSNMCTTATLLASFARNNLIIHDYTTGEQLGETLTIQCEEIVAVKLAYSPTHHVDTCKHLLKNHTSVIQSISAIVYQLFVLVRSRNHYALHRYNFFVDEPDSKLFQIVSRSGQLMADNLIPPFLAQENFSALDFDPESGVLVVAGDSILFLKNDRVVAVMTNKTIPSLDQFVHVEAGNIENVRKCRIVYCTPEMNAHSMYPNTNEYKADVLLVILLGQGVMRQIVRVDLVSESHKVTCQGISDVAKETKDIGEEVACDISQSGRYIAYSFYQSTFWTAYSVDDVATREHLTWYSTWQAKQDFAAINEQEAFFLSVRENELHLRACKVNSNADEKVNGAIQGDLERICSIHTSVDGRIFIAGVKHRKCEIHRLRM